MTAPSPSFSTTISRKRRKRAATEPCGQAVRWPSPPRSAPACHVLLDAEDMHTQCHSGPTFPLLPCNSMKEVSAPPCSRAGAEMVWWVGGGGNKEERRGEKRKHNISLTHVPLAACVYRCGMQVEKDMCCWWWYCVPFVHWPLHGGELGNVCDERWVE